MPNNWCLWSLTTLAGFVALPLFGCTRRPVADDEPHGVRVAEREGSSEQPEVNGVDLLVVVDDSLSMVDKQEVLSRSFERMQFMAYSCNSPATGGLSVPSADGSCPEGWGAQLLLPAVRSAAVISSSLEAAGACAATSRGAHPLQSPSSPRLNGRTSYVQQVREVGDRGCGFEAPLEAMYRFLVDPSPPLMIESDSGAQGPELRAQGIDQQLLEQRKEFLGPYTQVVVIILTDEDDCSVLDRGDAWKMVDSAPLVRASSDCATDPAGPCCRSCDAIEDTAKEGCTALDEDPVCAVTPQWEPTEDHLQLRCFDQKRRFGRDFLFPTSRYVDALTKPEIEDRDGQLAPNPLFVSGRTPDMVSVLLIAGTPWQLLLDEDASAAGQLHLLEPNRYEGRGLWKELLGDGETRSAAADSHMIQSIGPRSGLPLEGEDWDPIHGHEVTWGAEPELQYSCVFDLPQDRDCGLLDDCACSDDSADRPICRNAAGGYDLVQRRAQAYPPTRLLEFVRGLGQRGMVGSVCPRSLNEDNGTFDFNYGYAAAMSLLAHGTYNFWSVDCFSPSLPVDGRGLPLCHVIETYASAVACEDLGRVPVAERFVAPLRKAWAQAEDQGLPPELVPTYCEIPPFSGDATQPESDYFACQNQLHPSLQGPGYCYIDKSLGEGNSELLTGCIQHLARRIRVIPAAQPFLAARHTVVCDYGE
jgi:hypothetical protein